MATYTAKVKRSGDWWAVTVPQVPGLFTQGRTLAEVKDMVRRALELYPEIEPDPDTAEVVVQLDTPAGEEAAAAVARNRALAEEKEAAAAATASAARHLVAQGLTYRDTAVLLDISHQRVAQLVSD
ncbi:hypothetical protein HMPREF3053_09935 [Corynebacterium sp. HMSC064E07]|uniref:type II toxin-antitoxin system HicB family antitoxin n=1 Tax=Corynebacterium sp. HMSC064E07 TaxID=1739545 RepID=UPI0008A4115A|nr:type II toxin-antitoxin system HicB family antitoxin [Corynebacterium sp. HMSC064E07]OFO26459.1 hypothetical protein HMPREF3053_09935 [Corynebacterium sp. HMSC064E07]